MIRIKLDGGLGNQMFQYAFIKSVAQGRNQQFQLDLSTYARSKSRGSFELEHLNVCKSFTAVNSFFTDLLFLRGLRKLGIQKLGKIFVETTNTYTSEALKSSYTYFYGYFQSFKYFDQIRSSLLQEFKFSNVYQSPYYTLILLSESVGIHVRKGDYVSNKKVFDFMYQLEKDYYLAGAKKILELTTKPLNFFLFSNDLSWVETNILPELEKMGTCTIVNHLNKKESSLFDLECLKNCKHQIISNSSFSWWAAYLNSYENRKVVAPARWYKKGDWNLDDLYPKEWIKQ